MRKARAYHLQHQNYMAASEDCDSESYPYATDCYACENIDVEARRHDQIDGGLVDANAVAIQI